MIDWLGHTFFYVMFSRARALLPNSPELSIMWRLWLSAATTRLPSC